MTTVKLFSQNKRTIGTKSTLPVVGEVSFDKVDNSIEIDSSLLEQLRLKDFGIILLTAEEAERKKNEEFLAQKQKAEARKALPSILLDQQNHPLINCILALKNNRSAEDQLLIDEIVESHFYSGKDVEPKTDFREQLRALALEDIDALLEEYPKTATMKLKTTEDKISYLIKKK